MKAFTHCFILLLGIFFGDQNAFAGANFYNDAGMAAIQMHNESPLYGSGVPASHLGYGVNFGVWSVLTNPDRPMGIQFGLVGRYTSTSSSSPQATYGFMAAYPAFRLQLSRLYFSAGATPFVWKSLTYNGTSSSFSRSVGGIAYLGEAGLLFPVTPRFSFGTSVSVESVHTSAGSGPSPIGSANFFMRFYYGFGSETQTKSNEFHGWRYPFGRDLY
jgi:hypothetical protein